MSGGHFEYKYYQIQEFAEELKKEIEMNDDKTEDEFGDRIGRGYRKETIDRLKKAQRIIETAGKLAREIEWLYSDDHSEETFNELADEIFKNV